MDKFQVDELKLYMSEDVKIANGIVLKCPKIKDIVMQVLTALWVFSLFPAPKYLETTTDAPVA